MTRLCFTLVLITKKMILHSKFVLLIFFNRNNIIKFFIITNSFNILKG